jgi:hypothetical protein
MSSWSEEREKGVKKSPEEIRKCIIQVNSLLKKFSLDSDLTDDLADPIVQVAIKHWTNEKRLSPEEAQNMLEDNFRISSVLEKFHLLQYACKQLGIPVPLDHLLARQKCLSEKLVKTYFGEEFWVTEPGRVQVEKKVAKNRAKGDKVEEFGPQLPSSSSEELTESEKELENKITKIMNWGKEPMGSEGFSWFKLVVRSMGEVVVIGIVGLLISLYFGPKKT